jgi:hypothetical protein
MFGFWVYSTTYSSQISLIFFFFLYNILLHEKKESIFITQVLCLMMCFECAFDFVTYITSHIHLIFNGHYISSYFLWNLHFVTTYFVYVQIFLVFSNQEKLINLTKKIWKTKKQQLSLFIPSISHAIISLRCSELLALFLYT